MQEKEKRIKTMLKELEKVQYSTSYAIEHIWIKKGDYTFKETCTYNIRQLDELGFRPFQKDETWGGLDQHFWFIAQVTVPQDFIGKKVVSLITTGATDIWNTDNPQIIVYKNKTMVATLDMNHKEVVLSETGIKDEVFDLAFYAYSNSEGMTNFFDLKIATHFSEIEKLYYDLKVVYEAALLSDVDSIERIKLMEQLNICVNHLDLRQIYSKAFFISVEKATGFLKAHIYDKHRNNSEVTVHSVGHTHIDVAWKWQVKQTKQKVIRSFLTVLELMERYPEYKFMSSQPLLYEFVKKKAPRLYQRIKERIQEGRWEVEGGMWVEADCNLTSGESLIRQIIYGKKFVRDEFGINNQEVLWLPDVFGYSVALPQILKKSGIKYFMTTKLGWNEFNKIPNDTMMWQGLDGSEILTYFITTTDYVTEEQKQNRQSYNTTYNGLQNPSQIKGTWQRYQNKELSTEVLTCYGYGDGGGGPTKEMLEQNRRMEKVFSSCPRTKQTFVREFFHILEETIDKKAIPKWCGELYLETHRGTYTSMARNKKSNRQSEIMMNDMECICVLAHLVNKSYVYPKPLLDKTWKLLLLNQFHDILPGSSIKEVYEDTDIDYAVIKENCHQIFLEAKSHIISAIDNSRYTKEQACSLMVINTLSFKRRGLVYSDSTSFVSLDMPSYETYDGKRMYLLNDIEPKSVTCINSQEAVGNTEQCIMYNQCKTKSGGLEFETENYDIIVSKQGELESIYDKIEKRQLLKNACCGNVLQVFEDRPAEFDAWNIDVYFEEKCWEIKDLQKMEIIENNGMRSCIEIKRNYMNSTILQRIFMYKHTRRIDFETIIDWKEERQLLKVLFPLDLNCVKATYDVQFGNVERPTHKNTSWDRARFEVCAHKWVDISEWGYGVALLNDCKYGYDVRESDIRLSLIKSGVFPNPDADKEVHTFTYALYPHQGDFRQGRVIQEAYDLNTPLYTNIIEGNTDFSKSLLSLDHENVFVDTIKQAEEGHDIIIRMYEAYGKRSTVCIESPLFLNHQIRECDCMENPEHSVAVKGSSCTIELKPYEIKTLRIIRGC